MYTVYQHRNLKNGKSYIGMTSREPKERWHSGWGYQNNSQMWSDIKESDWNKDWEHSIIGQFEDKQEALNLEEMFIRLFDSINEGYNTSAYSSHSCKHSEESKRKMSESKIGITLSEEHKKKISEALSGEKAYWYGKHFSEEHRKKISQSKGGRGILQFSKDGEFIAEYPSTGEAERQTGCHHQNICNCCKGERKSAGGFIWKYKEIQIFSKNSRLGLDEYNTFMIECMCKGKGGILPTKKEN